MAGVIKDVSGRVTFIDRSEIKFNSLVELMEIVRSEQKTVPEYISFMGLASDSKTYRMTLDFNLFGEQNIDVKQIRQARYQKFLGEILVAADFNTRKTQCRAYDERPIVVQ